MGLKMHFIQQHGHYFILLKDAILIYVSYVKTFRMAQVSKKIEYYTYPIWTWA